MLIDGLKLTSTGRVQNSSIEHVSTLPSINLYDGREVVLTANDGFYTPGPYTYLAGVWIQLVSRTYVDSAISQAIANSSVPYDIASAAPGKPVDGATIMMFVSPRTFQFPANLAGSIAKSLASATASSTFTINKNGTAVASFTFAASSATATFSTQAAIPVAVGDILTITAPATADLTLSDIMFSLDATL